MSLFDFLKHKPKEARPIFESLGTDMHCHLVPMVDDGSKSMDESMACLRVMRAAGFENIICTPHFQFPRFPNEENDIRRFFTNLQKDISAHGGVDGLKLAGVGGEYRIDSGFQDRIDKNKFLLVADKYLLVEFSLHQQVMGLDEILFDLQMKGFDIILAHPERYPYYSAQSSRLEHFKEMGILFQINILSLSGFYGEGPRQKAFQFVENGWAELMGTDMHNTLYAQALIDASHDRKIEKLLEHHTFMNRDLLNIHAPKANKI